MPLRIALLFVSVASFLVCLGSPMSSAPAQEAPTAAPRLGRVNFPASCAAHAQPFVETGVALLHSFQYQQADQSFTEAAKRDPKCGIAYWGKAMTHYEQLGNFRLIKN